MKKIILFTLFILVSGLVLSGCSGESSQPQKKKDELTIYTTVFPLQYFTQRIGGKSVNVNTIYPPGADLTISQSTKKF